MPSLKQKKHLLFVTPLYQPAIGGAATYFDTLSEYLKSKANIIVLTTYYMGSKRTEEKEGVTIYRIIPNLLTSPKILRYLFLPSISFLAMIFLSIKYKPICIHAHASTGVAFGPLLFSYLSRIPLFLDVQELFTPPWILRTGNIQKYVAFGPAVERRLLDIGILKEKIRTFIPINPPLVDEIAQKSKHRKNSKEFRIISIGELSKIKGVDILLSAFKLLSSKRGNTVKLTMIGDGPERTYCEDFINRHHLEKNIRLLGKQDYKTTLLSLKESNLVIIASRSESWCRVIIEAFRLEVPVIATDVGGIPLLIKNTITGILVKPNNPAQIAEATHSIMNKPALRKKLIKNGLHFVNSMLTWKQLSEEMYKMYDVDAT